MPSGPVKLFGCFISVVVVGCFFFSYDFVLTVVGRGREWERGKCGQAGGRMKYL